MNRPQKLIVGVVLILMGIATFGLIPFVHVQYEYEEGGFLLVEGEATYYPQHKTSLKQSEINPLPAYGCIFIGLLLAGSGLLFMCSTKR